MAQITPEELKNASPFMGEFWKEFLKLYYNPEDDEKYWNDVVKKTVDIAEKYCKDDPVLIATLLGAQRGLENKAKNQAEKTYKYISTDDIIDPLNRLFKAMKELNKAMDDLKNAYSKGQKVELTAGSITATATLRGTAE